MDKFLFNVNFLRDISQIESKKIIFDYINQLSKRAIGRAENEFLDIKNVSIEDLRIIPKSLVEIEGDKIKFTSEESLCFIYSYFLFNRNTIDNIEKLKSFLTEIRKENHKLGYKVNQIINANVIILYENSGHNISQELLEKYKIEDSIEYNMVTFPFVNAIPYLNLESSSFLAFLSVFQKRNNGPNIILSVDINESVREYSKLQPEKGKLLLDVIISKQDEEIITIIPNILLGLSESKGLRSIYDETVDLYNNSQILNIKKMALYTLGYFNYDIKNDEELIENTVNLYHKCVTNLNLDYLNDIVQASHYLIRYSKEPINWIGKASEIQNDFLSYNVAFFLNKNSGKFQKEQWFKDCLLNLSTMSRSYALGVRELDFILLSIVDDDPMMYLEFLRRWIEKHEVESRAEQDERVTKLFLSSLFELYRSNKELLEEFITDCFNQNDEKFQVSISNIVHELGTYSYKDLTLSEKYLDKITAKDTIFIITKIVGYILGYEELCSFIFSAIKSQKTPNDVIKHVKETFIYYIGYNYPEYTINFFEGSLNEFSEKDKFIANEIILELRKKEENFKSLKYLKEFETPRNKRLTYNSLKSLEQARMMEEAREGSIFLNLVNTTILKGGKSSFTKFDGQYTEKMKLGEHRVSMYLPQGEFKDPIGQAILRYRCRTNKK